MLLISIHDIGPGTLRQSMLLRQIVERQAIRRVEGGSLSEAEIERLGTTLMQLSEQMDLLKKHFGLKDEDLNIDLGPLGRLL